jgi:nitrile hydratase
MNGIHDLGGMHGFGPVDAEPNEPYFHHEWEKTVLALQQATRLLRMFNIDEFRHGIERMEPVEYLRASYYERWLASITTNLIEKGLISDAELAARIAALAADPDTPRPQRDDPELVERLMNRGPRPPRADDGSTEYRFNPGDEVITRNFHPPGHTRLPRYVRAKRGVVDHLQGVQVFADTNAHGLGRQPQMVYSVRFRADELWGESAEPNQLLYIDLWESYLEPVK